MNEELLKINRLTRKGLLTFTPVTVPAGLKRILCTTNIHPEDASDETQSIVLRIDVSRDGGTTWVKWGGFGWSGRPEFTGGPTGRNPACDLPAPEPGALVRLVLDLSREIRIGVTIWLK